MSAKEGTLLGELREFLSSTAGKSQAALGVTPGPQRSPGSEPKDDPKGRAIPSPQTALPTNVSCTASMMPVGWEDIMMASLPSVMAVSHTGNEKFDVLNCSGFF